MLLYMQEAKERRKPAKSEGVPQKCSRAAATAVAGSHYPRSVDDVDEDADVDADDSGNGHDDFRENDADAAAGDQQYQEAFARVQQRVQQSSCQPTVCQSPSLVGVM